MRYMGYVARDVVHTVFPRNLNLGHLTVRDLWRDISTVVHSSRKTSARRVRSMETPCSKPSLLRRIPIVQSGNIFFGKPAMTLFPQIVSPGSVQTSASNSSSQNDTSVLALPISVGLIPMPSLDDYPHGGAGIYSSREGWDRTSNTTLANPTNRTADFVAEYAPQRVADLQNNPRKRQLLEAAFSLLEMENPSRVRCEFRDENQKTLPQQQSSRESQVRKTPRKKASTAKPRPRVYVLPRGIGPVKDPNDNDVLSGRGGRVNAHSGNVQLRAMVAQHKDGYLSRSTKKLEKAYIAADIVYHIRSLTPPGRFLVADPDGSWYDIGDERAIRKVAQALREQGEPSSSKH